ncbi:hypothetical protein GW17_00030673 [Ensete ventricosum]|nr:hypothetical protein GW17_00030673 [Ensete ventricosum]
MRLLAVLFILQAIFAVGSDARRLRDGGGCAELYVAEEGDTLQTISVKCDDLFILDDNPHIVDSDDIGQGTKNKKRKRRKKNKNPSRRPRPHVVAREPTSPAPARSRESSMSAWLLLHLGGDGTFIIVGKEELVLRRCPIDR